MPNSSDDHRRSPSVAFASLSEELHPATGDQTRGVRQSLEQIRSLTSDATERLIESVLGHEDVDRRMARAGLKHFVQDTADILQAVMTDLDDERGSSEIRRNLRDRLATLASRSGIEVEPAELDAEHVHDLGRRMGDALSVVLQSLQVDDLVNQLADEILGRLDRLDVLSEQIQDTAVNLRDADVDEMRRFAERLLELGQAIGKMREEWAGSHRRVGQEQMEQGEIELF
jgi:hypothetical protein